MNKLDSLIAPQTKDFVTLCRNYFEYLEVLPDKKIEDFWAVQLRMLSDIYSGIFGLPEINARYAPDVEKFVTERDYNKIFNKLSTYIGNKDKFPDFSNLNQSGTFKVVEFSLSEMLTDIYQELKDFVLLYESGTLENMNDAIIDCFDTFGQYWGAKLLGALRIIHVSLYQHRYAEAKKSSQLDVDIEEDMAEETYFDENE